MNTMIDEDEEFTSRELDLLHLKELPFRISADSRFLYLTEGHQWALSRLEKSIRFREGLSVVEGPIGTGKTSMARRLLELCLQKHNLEPVYIHTPRYPTQLAALHAYSEAFRTKIRKTYVDQLKDFERTLIKLREAKKNPVLIIDDAQYMGPESLQPIQDFLNFDISSKMIQCILFGQQEIHGNFARNPALLDRVVFWHKLAPLSFGEMIRMIQFRLAIAGREKPMFNDTALEELYRFSQGVPRPLIIVCNETLHLLVDAGRDNADATDVSKAVEIYKARPPRTDYEQEAAL
jgi:general secretion pathway protein A